MPYHSLFPTTVFHDHQPALAEYCLPIAHDYLVRLGEQFQDQANHWSTYRSQQASKETIVDQRLMPVYDLIRRSAESYLDHLSIDYLEYSFKPFYFFNSVSRGAGHALHSHPGSVLSGCFYLDCAEDSPPIVFKDPRAYTEFVSYPLAKNRLPTARSLTFEHTQPVHRGMLIMWPSWLAHTVPMSHSTNPRITLAFNLNA